MFKEHYNMVAAFQQAFNQPVGMSWEQWNVERKELREALLMEEYDETEYAYEDGDDVGVLDGYVDQAYIMLGSINELAGTTHPDGIVYISDLVRDYYDVAWRCKEHFGLENTNPFYEAFKRVHESNMSKLVDGKPLINGENGVYDESKPLGKVLKPDTYIPVDLSDLV